MGDFAAGFLENFLCCDNRKGSRGAANGNVGQSKEEARAPKATSELNGYDCQPLSKEALVAMLRRVELLQALGEPEIEAAVGKLEEQTFSAGHVVYRQDNPGDACYFVLAGECYALARIHNFDEGTRVKHKKRGEGVVDLVTKDPNITRVTFDIGECHRYGPASLHKLKPVAAVEPRVEEVEQIRRGGHFGWRALSRVEPRPVTVTCRTDVTVLRLTAETFLELKQQQDHKEELLRGVGQFETFSDDQIASLAAILQPRALADKEAIISQGDEGQDMYLLDKVSARPRALVLIHTRTLSPPLAPASALALTRARACSARASASPQSRPVSLIRRSCATGR